VDRIGRALLRGAGLQLEKPSTGTETSALASGEPGRCSAGQAGCHGKWSSRCAGTSVAFTTVAEGGTHPWVPAASTQPRPLLAQEQTVNTEKPLRQL